MASEKLFARKATGLVREIGFTTAVLLAICNMVGLGWQKRVYQVTGWAPIPESSYIAGMPPVITSFFVVGLIVLAICVSYSAMSAAMPRSGGGYVYVSRLIHPFVSYLNAHLGAFSTAISYGQISTAVLEVLVAFAGLAGIDTSAVNNPWGMFAFGFIVVVIFCAFGYFGVKMQGYLLQVMFAIPAAISAIVYGVLIAATPGAMTTGITTLTGVAPDAYVRGALAAGIRDAGAKYDYWGAVATANIGTLWAYGGYSAATYVAGEVKEANRTMPRAVMTSGILVVLIYMSASYLMFRAASMVGTGVTPDYTFFGSWAYLSYGGPGVSASTVPGLVHAYRGWLPITAAFAAEGLGLGSLKVLLACFASLWIANDIPPFLLSVSRTYFAMAFDRVLPTSIAAVNRYHSPFNAIVLCGVLAVVGIFSEVFMGWGNWVNWPEGIYLFLANIIGASDLWTAVYDFLVGCCVLVMVFKRKDIWEKAPWKGKLGIEWVPIIGFLSVIGAMYLGYCFLWSPMGYDVTHIAWGDITAFGPGGSGWLVTNTVILLVIFAIIYFAMKWRAKASGIDMGTIYQEIPPE
jgi:amino acid transporter